MADEWSDLADGDPVSNNLMVVELVPFLAQTSTSVPGTPSTVVEQASSSTGDLILTWGTFAIALAAVVYAAWNGYRNRALQKELSTKTAAISEELVRIEKEAVAVQEEQLRIERGREHRELAPDVIVEFESGEPLRVGQARADREWDTQNPRGVRVSVQGPLPVYELVADLLWQAGETKEYTVGTDRTRAFAGASFPPLISIVPHDRVDPEGITTDLTDRRAGDIYKRLKLGVFAPGDSRWLGAQPEASGTGDTMEVRIVAGAAEGAWASFHKIVVPDARVLDPR